VNYQRLLIDHFDLVAQIVRTTGRRRHLSVSDREDFGSYVNLRLVEDDYAILRKFQNRSSLRTYLVMVIERLSLDYCVEQWGRWRPSAMAERLGPIAVNLERLVTRDHHSIDEAIEILRTNYEVVLSDAELRRIWEQLPTRTRTISVGEEAAAEVSSDDSSEGLIEESGVRERIERLQRTLQTALAQIPAHDRVLIALRFDQDLSIIEIAKLTNGSVPTLHRRIDKIVKQLRLALTQAGFDPREVASLMGHPSIGLSPLLRAEVESFFGSVRLYKRDG